MADPWAEFIPQAAPAAPAADPWAAFNPVAAPQQPIGFLEAGARGGAQGATFATADELSGLAAASPLWGAREKQTSVIPNAVDTIAGVARVVAEKIAPGIFGTGGGEAYDRETARQRALLTQARKEQPLAAYGGELGGGLLMPLGAGAQAVTRGQAAVQGAKAGAIGGALYGAGQGEDLTGRLTGAATGAATGAVLGGGIGGAIGPRAAPAAAPVNDVVGASERIGVQVPNVIAADSIALQRAGQAAKNIPFAGDPLVKATENMVGGLGRAADDVAAGLGASDRAGAGSTAAAGIKDWITGKSKAAVNRAYDAVDNVINQNIRTPLGSTLNTVSRIMAERQNATIQGSSKAVDEVLAGVTSPNGLNYAGIKGLRTRIGELMDTGILPADISGTELKQIYGALSQDLKLAAANAGGQRGLQLFERANRFNKAVATRREELAKIVGANGDVPAEQVFDRLVRFAGEKGGADINRLAKARNAIGGDWNEVASGLVTRMGRDAEGNFTPDRFSTAWGGLSDAGKTVLFGRGAHRQALEDIFTVSSQAKDIYKKFGNPSGTSQNLAGGGIVAGLFTAPMTTIGTVVGGNVLSRILAQPATASSMAKWSRAYNLAVSKPGRATGAALQSASKQLSSTIGDNLGVDVPFQAIMGATVGGQR